jgi:hypothetical protein
MKVLAHRDQSFATGVGHDGGMNRMLQRVQRRFLQWAAGLFVLQGLVCNLRKQAQQRACIHAGLNETTSGWSQGHAYPTTQGDFVVPVAITGGSSFAVQIRQDDMRLPHGPCASPFPTLMRSSH